jgi:hypothetical protein
MHPQVTRLHRSLVVDAKDDWLLLLLLLLKLCHREG